MVKSFTLGKSELLLGDFHKTLDSVKNVRLILTSPPYNIGSGGERSDGMRRSGKFDNKSFARATLRRSRFRDIG